MIYFKIFSKNFIHLIFIISILCINNISNDKIIISLTSDKKNIKNTKNIIKSIFQENKDYSFYEILLILSYKDFDNSTQITNEFHDLQKMNKINLLFTNEYLTVQKRTIFSINKYKKNAILIINNLCKIPNGWLDMFIVDHLKYPNDAIIASIQYFFGKKCDIKELNEGFKGEKFGIFNHVSELIFNFAIINIDLGGILYPKNFFQNPQFFNYSLFLNSTDNSADFWQSAFMIIEDKNLRQSSVIYDFTKYMIDEVNYQEYYENKKNIYNKSKISFIKNFKNFTNYIKKRQSKIIVSIASYPERFNYLPDLMHFINNQSFHINKINFFFYEKHKKFFNFHLKGARINFVEKNLRSHLKYYYAMKLFRDHAIITLDDDLGYAKDTFESLFNNYVENPNVISGRRGHLMTFKNNGELKKYIEWKFEQRKFNESLFNITLTNGAGSIFPPDIFNIKDDFLPIINETITCDDLTLKYFATIKAIPHKWIVNNKVMGVKRILPKSHSLPLFDINIINNDICINKLNIMINKAIVNNLCVQYKNIHTGLIIHLFDIHNQVLIRNKSHFDIYAFSYCPINTSLAFNIYFDNYCANCSFNESKMSFSSNKYKKESFIIASCSIDKLDKNLDDYYFIKAKSKQNLYFNIYNYRTHLTTIFKDFFCYSKNNCILKVILLDKMKIHCFQVRINENYYHCIEQKHKVDIYSFPVYKLFKCKYLKFTSNIKRIFVSGIPFNISFKKTKKTKNNVIIPYRFIVKRIIADDIYGEKKIIIIGNSIDNLEKSLYNFSINLLFPNHTLHCNLKPYSKFVQSKIYCINSLDIKSYQFLIENQIVKILDCNKELLLINDQTLIKLQLKIKERKYKIKNDEYLEKVLKKCFNKTINIILFLLIIIIIKFKQRKKLKGFYNF